MKTETLNSLRTPSLRSRSEIEDGPEVDVEDLADAVLGEVVEVLARPLERVVVGLADAAEVAGDGVRAAEVDVAAVDAARVQRLDVRGAEDLHGGGDGEDVAAGRALLGHVAHADVAAGHELAAVDGALRLGDQPGEVLQGADLEGDGVGLVEAPRRAAGARARRAGTRRALTNAPASRCSRSQSSPASHGERSSSRRARRLPRSPASSAARLMASTPPNSSTRSSSPSTSRLCSPQSTSLTASTSSAVMRRRLAQFLSCRRVVRGHGPSWSSSTGGQPASAFTSVSTSSVSSLATPGMEAMSILISAPRCSRSRTATCTR